jgi:hypothetical protein
MIGGVAKTLTTLAKGFRASFKFPDIVLQFLDVRFGLFGPKPFGGFNRCSLAPDVANVGEVLPNDQPQTSQTQKCLYTAEHSLIELP